jgi:hypothetical protein
MTQETKLPNAPQRSQSFFNLLYLVFYKQPTHERSFAVIAGKSTLYFLRTFSTVTLLRGWTIYYLFFLVISVFSDIRLFCLFSLICRSSLCVRTFCHDLSISLFGFPLSLFPAFLSLFTTLFIHACTDS